MRGVLLLQGYCMAMVKGTTNTRTHWMGYSNSLEALAELGQGAQGTLTGGQSLHSVACRNAQTQQQQCFELAVNPWT